MKDPLQRNEILEPGQIINAYQTFRWAGIFIGSVELIKFTDAYDTYQTWNIRYISRGGHDNFTYTTVSPTAIQRVTNI